jgi:hypothetical protein
MKEQEIWSRGFGLIKDLALPVIRFCSPISPHCGSNSELKKVQEEEGLGLRMHFFCPAAPTLSLSLWQNIRNIHKVSRSGGQNNPKFGFIVVALFEPCKFQLGSS